MVLPICLTYRLPYDQCVQFNENTVGIFIGIALNLWINLRIYSFEKFIPLIYEHELCPPVDLGF